MIQLTPEAALAAAQVENERLRGLLDAIGDLVAASGDTEPEGELGDAEALDQIGEIMQLDPEEADGKAILEKVRRARAHVESMNRIAEVLELDDGDDIEVIENTVVAIRSGFWSLAATLGVDEDANMTDATKSAGDEIDALISAKTQTKRMDNMCERIEEALGPHMTLDDLLYELQINPNFLRETWPNGLPWRKEGTRAYSKHQAHRRGYATAEEAQAAELAVWRRGEPHDDPPPPVDDAPPPDAASKPRTRRAR